MVNRRYRFAQRFRFTIGDPPQDFRFPASYVERVWDSKQFTGMFDRELIAFRVSGRGMAERQISEGDIIFVDRRLHPGFGQPAVFADGTLDIFTGPQHVIGSVVGVFREVKP